MLLTYDCFNYLDMAVHRKQTCVFEHSQNEDVCDSGCGSHGIWSYTWYFQPPVSL